MAVKIIKNTTKIKRDNLPLVIGYFGCIHVMHQQLLTKYHDFNVLTFTGLMSKREHQIYSYKWRIENLQKFNPKNIYVLDVSHSNMTGMAFINTILNKIDPSEILVGEDFKFGSDNLTNKILKNYFKVSELRYNPAISTKKIHDLIVDKKVDEANDFCSFNLYYQGKWVTGNRRGRKIGFPTINIQNEKPFIIPEGSYITLITLGNKQYRSVSFVGQASTKVYKGPIIETHIYGRKIPNRLVYPPWIRNTVKVEFLKYLRGNVKNPNNADLKEIISGDIEKAKKYFKQQDI